MIELPLVFLSGLLGSGHCVGMCGAFAVAIGWDSRQSAENAIRQLCFSAGRATTYMFLGSVAGFAGQRLQVQLAWLASTQAVLCMIVGVLLLLAGMAALGWLPAPFRWLGQSDACLLTTRFRSLLRSPKRLHVCVAGLLTGFLPCGLVYAILALASGTASIAGGAIVMGTFALGTMPLMVATGLGSALLSVRARNRLLRLAACCVLLMGGLTVTRGAMGLASVSRHAAPSCPLCQPHLLEDPHVHINRD